REIEGGLVEAALICAVDEIDVGVLEGGRRRGRGRRRRFGRGCGLLGDGGRFWFLPRRLLLGSRRLRGGRRQRDLRRRTSRHHQAERWDRYGTQEFHFRRYPCPVALAFPVAAACACRIACSTSASAASAPRGSAQMKSPTWTTGASALMREIMVR